MSWLVEFGMANELSSWLGYSALSGLTILGLGSLAVWLCREPIYRIRIIQWTFVACLLVPAVQQLGVVPGLGLPVLDAQPEVETTAVPTVSPALTETIATPDQIEPTAELLPIPTTQFSVAAETESAVGTSTEPTTSPEPAITVIGVIRITYLAFAGLFFVWWGVGLALRQRMIRNAKPASESVRGVLRSIAGKRAERVRLLTSDHVKSPVMWGLFRPTIIIPTTHAKKIDSPQLRWGLAHEWCHVQRFDFLTHLLATATKFVCFFQPCFWWLKRELALSQDLLADAFATQQGHPEEYAAFLVSLAKQKTATPVPVGLGIIDSRSTLFRRIRTLLKSTAPRLQANSRWPMMMITVVALVVMTGFGSIHFTARAAEDKDDSKPAVQETEKKETEKKEDSKLEGVEPITYTGKVINRETGEPIAGATVQIKRELSRDPKTGKWILLEMTEHKSDEKGNYSFTLPPEQVAESSLYLEVNAQHPNYQDKGWSGYSHSMIRTNLEKGDPPFYETIKLSGGEAITGTITTPDGEPIAGVQVGSYSKGVPAEEEKDNFRFRGAFQNAETDENGKFRLVVATPGDGVLWIHPAEYAPQAHRLKDRRGDLGTFKMEEGIVMRGRVLDAKGNPVPEVGVSLSRRGDGEEADEFLNANAVANGIRGGTMSDKDGNFTMKPLPKGTYGVRVEQSAHDPTVKRGDWFERRRDGMKHVFARSQIEVTESEEITIQALPHVVIRGRFFDGEGKPRVSHAQHFFGRHNETFYFTQSTRPGKDGWFEFRVPHGVTEAKINTMTNEHSALRWKLADMDELSYGREIPLGDLEADVEGLEMVRYKAPILLVSAEDEEGNPIEKLQVKSTYTKRPVEIEGMRENGIYRSGDVGFEKQSDGRYRSSQMLPDAELTVEIDKAGFETEPQAVTLKEAETREIKFVLTKKLGEAEEESSEDESAAKLTGKVIAVPK